MSFPTQHFECCTFDHSDNSPYSFSKCYRLITHIILTELRRLVKIKNDKKYFDDFSARKKCVPCSTSKMQNKNNKQVIFEQFNVAKITTCLLIYNARIKMKVQHRKDLTRAVFGQMRIIHVTFIQLQVFFEILCCF